MDIKQVVAGKEPVVEGQEPEVVDIVEKKEPKEKKLIAFLCYCKNNSERHRNQTAERWAVNPKTNQVQFFVDFEGMKEGENIVCSLMDASNWEIREATQEDLKKCLNCGADLPQIRG